MLEKTFYNEFLKRSFTIPMKVTFWDGKTKQYGSGTPQAHITIHKAIPIKELRRNASIALGEAYMDGTIDVDGNLEDLITSAYEAADSFFSATKSSSIFYQKLLIQKKLAKPMSRITMTLVTISTGYGSTKP